MGYYADARGTIILENKPSSYDVDTLRDFLGDVYIDNCSDGRCYIALKYISVYFSKCRDYMYLDYSGRYHQQEKDIISDLDCIAKLPIKHGAICFEGEDGDWWKFQYDTSERKWVKQIKDKGKPYVWVVKTDWAVNGESGNSVAIYASENLARKAFQEEVSAVRQNAEDRGYVIEEDNDYFESYEDGEYLLYHDTISVEKMEVITS